MSVYHLTVVRDFGSYQAGGHIEDEAEIARIMAGELARHVVKVAADEKSAPQPPALPVPAAKGPALEAIEKA